MPQVRNIATLTTRSLGGGATIAMRAATRSLSNARTAPSPSMNSASG